MANDNRNKRMGEYGRVPGPIGALVYMVIAFMKEVLFTIFGQKNFQFTNDRIGLTRSAMFMFIFIIIHAVGNLHVFLGPDDFNGYGYFYVRLYWTGFGFNANIVEEYILLAALLHVAVGLKRTWDISINYTIASGKLNLAISGITLLTFMSIHLFQFRFGDTQPFELCPPPYLINVATLLELRLNLFWVHDADCVKASVRDIYRMEFEVFQSLGWCLFYISAVAIFATHMCLGWQKAVPAPALEIPKRFHNKAIHIGYIMTAFIALVYVSFPLYTHIFPMSDGAITPEAPLPVPVLSATSPPDQKESYGIVELIINVLGFADDANLVTKQTYAKAVEKQAIDILASIGEIAHQGKTERVAIGKKAQVCRATVYAALLFGAEIRTFSQTELDQYRSFLNRVLRGVSYDSRAKFGTLRDMEGQYTMVDIRLSTGLGDVETMIVKKQLGYIGEAEKAKVAQLRDAHRAAETTRQETHEKQVSEAKAAKKDVPSIPPHPRGSLRSLLFAHLMGEINEAVPQDAGAPKEMAKWLAGLVVTQVNLLVFRVKSERRGPRDGRPRAWGALRSDHLSEEAGKFHQALAIVIDWSRANKSTASKSTQIASMHAQAACSRAASAAFAAWACAASAAPAGRRDWVPSESAPTTALVGGRLALLLRRAGLLGLEAGRIHFYDVELYTTLTRSTNLSSTGPHARSWTGPSSACSWRCKRCTGRGAMKFYVTGEALAKDMGVPISVLEQTHKGHFEAGKKTEKGPDGSSFPAYHSGKSWDEASGKTGSGKKFNHNVIDGPAVKSEPFYAAIILPVIHYCMGGLEIDADSACVGANGKAIPGLEAAGDGNNRLGGNSLLDSVVFGRAEGLAATKCTLGADCKPASLKDLSGGGHTGEVTAPKNAGGSHEDGMNKGAGGVKGYSMEEVAKHASKTDCWMVAAGEVLDATSFLSQRPGGELAILAFAREGATEEFNMIHPPDVIPKCAPAAATGALGAGGGAAPAAAAGASAATAAAAGGHGARDWKLANDNRNKRMGECGRVLGPIGALVYMVIAFMKEVLFTIFGRKNFQFTNDHIGPTRSAMFTFIFIITHAVGNLRAFLGPDDFNGYGYFYVRLFWAGFGFNANIVEKYILLAALLHVAVGLRRAWDISINYTIASGKLNLAISGITLLTFMSIHFFQLRFGDAQPCELCPPPCLINVATLLEPRLNLFWVHDADCVKASVRDIYRMEFEVFQSLGWCLFYISAVAIFAAHMRLGRQKTAPAPALEIPKRFHNKAIHIGYIMAAFIALVYVSPPPYTHIFPMSDGAITSERLEAARAIWRSIYTELPRLGIPKQLRARVVQATVLAALLFGSEIRTISQGEINEYRSWPRTAPPGRKVASLFWIAIVLNLTKIFGIIGTMEIPTRLSVWQYFPFKLSIAKAARVVHGNFQNLPRALENALAAHERKAHLLVDRSSLAILVKSKELKAEAERLRDAHRAAEATRQEKHTQALSEAKAANKAAPTIEEAVTWPAPLKTAQVNAVVFRSDSHSADMQRLEVALSSVMALAKDTGVPVSVLEQTHKGHVEAAKKTEKGPDGGSFPAYPSGKSWGEASGKTGSGKKFYPLADIYLIPFALLHAAGYAQGVGASVSSFFLQVDALRFYLGLAPGTHVNRGADAGITKDIPGHPNPIKIRKAKGKEEHAVIGQRRPTALTGHKPALPNARSGVLDYKPAVPNYLSALLYCKPALSKVRVAPPNAEPTLLHEVCASMPCDTWLARTRYVNDVAGVRAKFPRAHRRGRKPALPNAQSGLLDYKPAVPNYLSASLNCKTALPKVSVALPDIISTPLRVPRGPRRKGGAPRPRGHKKTFMLHAFFTRMRETAPGLEPDKTAGLTPQAKEAGDMHLAMFTQLGPKDLDRLFSGIASRYPKPMGDRTWLWAPTVNLVMIPEDLRLSLGHVMEMAECDGVDVKVELKQSNQGKPEEQLWTTLRVRLLGHPHFVNVLFSVVFLGGYLLILDLPEGFSELGDSSSGATDTREDFARDRGGRKFYQGVFDGPAVKGEPFYVAIITPVIHCCKGGLEIDADSACVGANGKAIPGPRA
ncbi:unnamed protein product, partial [Prorocentrum cordatum]